MTEKLHVNLVTPEALFLSASVDMIVIPGTEGAFGAMAHHEPLVSMVEPGVLEVHEGADSLRRIFIAGGYAQVQDTECTILAEELVDMNDLDSESIEREIREIRFAYEKSTNEKTKERLLKKEKIAQHKLELL